MDFINSCIQKESVMKYDFDKIIERRGSGAIKTDVLKEKFGRDDLTPLWVADMDFETPEFITDALKRRLEHSLYGYTAEPEEYWPTVIKWIQDHHQWKVRQEWLTFIPGIVKGIGMAINALLEKDEKVIIQPPVYHPFRLVPQGNRRDVVYNPLHENEDGTYSMDFENLEAVCDEIRAVMPLVKAICEGKPTDSFKNVKIAPIFKAEAENASISINLSKASSKVRPSDPSFPVPKGKRNKVMCFFIKSPTSLFSKVCFNIAV